MQAINALNVYQLNIHQTLLFMHKVKNGIIPSIFRGEFLPVNHAYRTRYSHNNYQIPHIKSPRFCLTVRCPTLWNKVLNDVDKNITSFNTFKQISKNKLLNNTNELDFF